MPASCATFAVVSVEASSTTRISYSRPDAAFCIAAMVVGSSSSSLYAGITNESIRTEIALHLFRCNRLLKQFLPPRPHEGDMGVTVGVGVGLGVGVGVGGGLGVGVGVGVAVGVGVGLGVGLGLGVGEGLGVGVGVG